MCVEGVMVKLQEQLFDQLERAEAFSKLSRRKDCRVQVQRDGGADIQPPACFLKNMVSHANFFHD